MSEIIAEKLIDIKSVQFSFNNHFTLTSGLKSPVYVDCRKIISFIEETPPEIKTGQFESSAIFTVSSKLGLIFIPSLFMSV